MEPPTPVDAPDTPESAGVDDHPFVPPDLEHWYARCDTCGLAESAHRCTLLGWTERPPDANPDNPFNQEPVLLDEPRCQ